MTLIDRYLRAVRDHLPRGQQDDIITELSDNLHLALRDEEAAAAGRLKSRPGRDPQGLRHPMAGRGALSRRRAPVTFGGRLIGPELFPAYMKILAVNVIITLLIAAIALVAGATIWSGFAGILVPLAIQFKIVTAIFIWIDRRWIRDPDGWDPRTSTRGSGRRRLDPRRHRPISCSARRTREPSASRRQSCRSAYGRRADRGIAVRPQERVGFMEPGPDGGMLLPGIAILVAAFITPVVNLLRPRWTRFRSLAPRDRPGSHRGRIVSLHSAPGFCCRSFDGHRSRGGCR